MSGIGWAVAQMKLGAEVRRAAWPMTESVALVVAHGDAINRYRKLPQTGVWQLDGVWVPWPQDLLADDWMHLT